MTPSPPRWSLASTEIRLAGRPSYAKPGDGTKRESTFGGAEGSRTPDLLIANETLYQLSYDPIKFCINELQPKLLGNEFPLLYGTSILYREKHGKPLTSW